MAAKTMGELLNLVGLSAGVVLYAMLLAMVVSAGRRPGTPSSTGFDRLLLVTSILGLVWNLCALPAYVLPKVGIAGPFPFLAAIGFGALGFLPAVVVHSVLRGERDGVRGRLKRSMAAVAYLVAAAAAVLHVNAAWTGSAVPSVLAMRLLTYTFVALIGPLVAATRGQHGSRRALWAAALSIFAVSALHLSQLHTGEASWPVELLGHHASLPLAFAILYQDYPFALADLFLKRALALLAIVSIAFVATAVFGTQSAAFAQFLSVDPRQVGILVTLWVGTALLYPWLRHLTAWFVDTIVLARPDYPSLRATIARRVQSHDQIPPLLSDVCDLLAPALNASSVTWSESETAGDDNSLGAVTSTTKANALVIVPASELPRYAITIAELTGGRRLLSDDLATLDAIAVLVARRIDTIRITRERVERELREQEIGRLATEAELRALRAQINPHFLFNALTAIAHLIQTAPPRALRTLMRLTALLRSVLKSEGELTTLGRELEVVEAYLDIERERFDERLRVTIDVPSHLRSVPLPPLILQPLVENAVKHGIAPRAIGGEVTVRACLNADFELSLIVHDTGAGTTSAALEHGRISGVGLRNVERRLECQYGPKASLSIDTTPGRGTVVEIRMPIDTPAGGQLDVKRAVM